MSKILVIVLLGPPGAGKGSQATLIREKMLERGIHMGHISTGDLLRENIKNKTPLGEVAKGFMDGGNLVPDDLIFEMLFDRVAKPDCKEGYILDGFPRTLPQADVFYEKIGKKSHFVALNLEISEQAILERLTKRVICEKCQRPYHLVFSPPKKAGICDACGGKLYQRSDDTEEVVKNRLMVYGRQTEPLIAYFKKLGVLHSIDASASKEVVLAQLMKILSF